MSRSARGIDRCKLVARFAARGYALSRPRAQRPHSRMYAKRTENHAYISAARYPPCARQWSCLSTIHTARHRLLFAASRVVVRCRGVRHVGRGRPAKRLVACCLGDCADDTRAVTIAVAKQGCFTFARIPGKGQDVLSSCFDLLFVHLSSNHRNIACQRDGCPAVIDHNDKSTPKARKKKNMYAWIKIVSAIDEWQWSWNMSTPHLDDHTKSN